MNNFHQLISDICQKLSINITMLSDDWLMVLEKDGLVRYIQGYKFSLNNQSLGNILDDKGLFYDLLTFFHLPIIEHYVIFNDYDHEKVQNYFDNHQQDLIVKGNIGTCGSEVYHVTKKADLFSIIDHLLESQYSLSLCPYYDIITEYRVIVLDNEVRLIYGKKCPRVIGDGMSSLKDLAKKFNPTYYNKASHLDKLADYVPLKGEEVLLDFHFNLSKGSVPFLDIPKDLLTELSDLALAVVNKTGLIFASIDIINTRDNKLLIMEANSGVMMNNFMKLIPNGKDIARLIYQDAITLMFKSRI